MLLVNGEQTSAKSRTSEALRSYLSKDNRLKVSTNPDLHLPPAIGDGIAKGFCSACGGYTPLARLTVWYESKATGANYYCTKSRRCRNKVFLLTKASRKAARMGR